MTSLGDFEVLEEIGRGGMGVVYRGRQRSLDRVVALKILPPELARDAQVAERFMAEARKMARVEHPNVAQVFAVGEEQGQQYMAMQFLPGGSLEDRLLCGPMPPHSAVTVAIQVADALEVAHQHGIIHRDIKPANIMFDAHGQAVVTDFGIAKAGDEVRKTRTGLAVGTPQYMAPEQARGNPVDERADVYALGVVLYEMVCGRPPFEGETPVSVAMKHVTETPLPPQVLCPTLEPWLGSVILKAMAKEPADRFGSAAEMAAALRSGQPVYVPAHVPVAPTYGGPAHPAHVPTQYQPGVKPPPAFPVWALVALIAAVGLALIGGAIVFARQQSTNVVVPSVVGQTQEDARSTLASAGGFQVVMSEAAASDSFPEGAIVSQEPAGGSQAARGTTVRLVPNKGRSEPQSVPVPERIKSIWRDLGAAVKDLDDSNRPWESYKRERGKQASWATYLQENRGILLDGNQRQIRLFSTVQKEANALALLPDARPEWVELRDQLREAGRVGAVRISLSDVRMKAELSGEKPSWQSNTDYGQAKKAYEALLGDGGGIGGSVREQYVRAFGTEGSG